MGDPPLKKIIDEHVIRVAREALAIKLASCINTSDRATVLVCILKGAAYFTVDLSRELEALGARHTIYFVEASSYRGQEQQDTVDIMSQLVPEKLAGKEIILIDELYDNGKTMHTIHTHLERLFTDTIITTCVMFKKRRPVDEYKYKLPDYTGMEVPNVWIVGYGLDDDGYGRGLVSLYAKPKPVGVDWTSDDWRIFID